MNEPATSCGPASANERILDLLIAIASGAGGARLQSVADTLGLPPSTAHRMTGLLVERGLLARSGRGHYVAGLALADLAGATTRAAVLMAVARPLLRRLARETGATVHLGIWNSDMVTYLVKEAHPGADVFTQEGGQLEGYCTAIGKILLAALPGPELDRYLAGRFVALTPHTVTDPARLRILLEAVKRQGHALDDQEMVEGLFCVAVPIRREDGSVVAAMSVSRPARQSAPPPEALRACAAAMSVRLGYRA